MSALETAVLQRTSADAAPPTSKPVRKLRGYRLPGEGSAFGLSVLSVITLLVLWWAATTFHWVPPLFLP
ncbi:hypothetical protein NLR85_24880, partial [Escherichia coli]|nr:hypothetical protein [Escherichia coli]